MPRRLTREELRLKHGNIRVIDVIKHLRQLQKDHPNLIVVPYMRESTHRQRKDGNLKYRESYLRRRLLRRGIECHEHRNVEVASGKGLKHRNGLRRAIKRTQRLQKQHPDRLVAIVTDTRNRLLRGRYYDGQAQTDNPDVDQLRELKKLAGNVTLATLIDPDASHARVRAFETRLAKQSKGLCGRPKKPQPGAKKARRKRLQPVAKRLRNEGRSLREISRELKIPLSTIAGWLK